MAVDEKHGRPVDDEASDESQADRCDHSVSNVSAFRRHREPLHPCGCRDDGLPHRSGVPAPPSTMARYVDPKQVAQYERGRRLTRVRAIRREQLREYFKKKAA